MLKAIVSTYACWACISACLASAAEEAPVRFEDSIPGCLQISIGDQPFGNFVWGDPEIPRPYFAQLHCPAGIQVTRNHPPNPDTDVADHGTYHPGLWMAFGDLNGSDFWRNKSRVVDVPNSLERSTTKNTGTFQLRFQYFDESDQDAVICEELLKCTITVLPEGYLLSWDSKFSSDQSFYFGDQEEMGLGVRVATPMRSEERERGDIPPGNGRIEDAKGRVNGQEVWGMASDWCDYSGSIDGQHAGVTLLCHPDNYRPSWFHARDYGLLVANLFGRKAFHKGEASRIEVKAGSTFQIRYGVFIYSSSQDAKPDLAKVYSNYVKLSTE